MSMNIVFLDAATLTVSDLNILFLKELGDVMFYDRTDPEDVLTRAQEADVVITNKVVLTEVILRKLPKLKYIAVAGTGFNSVHVDTAKELGIPVSNVSGYSSTGVAQHVFAMLLDVLNRSSQFSTDVHNGRWQASRDFCFYDHSISELSGKTMGIFGYGAIGEQVADIARAFGMEVLAYKRNPNESDKVRFVDMETLFSQSDVVSLHAPLNTESKDIVNAELLSKMKSTAILVNTARGPLIVEPDLVNALKNNELAYACLDVLSSEPPLPGNPLIGIENCLITPHVAWASLESRQRLVDGLVENIQSFKDGNIKNRVA